MSRDFFGCFKGASMCRDFFGCFKLVSNKFRGLSVTISSCGFFLGRFARLIDCC